MFGRLTIKKVQKFILTTCIFLLLNFLNPTVAKSAQAVDCFGVSSAGVEKNYYSSYDYVVNFYSLCNLVTISDINRLAGTSLRLQINGPQNFTESTSIGNLNNYKTYKFSLGNLRSGTYIPSIELSKAGEGRRTISLPRFSISNILECIELINDNTDTIGEITKITVSLKNICSEFTESDYASSSLKLKVTNFSNILPSGPTLPIGRLSTVPTRYVFEYKGLAPGIYMLSELEISDGVKVKSIPLDSLIVVDKTPTPTPTSDASKVPSVSKKLADVQLCVNAKNFEEYCTYAPYWYFSVCSIATGGSIEQKINGKWTRLKAIKIKLKFSSCKDTNPNLFDLEGTSYSPTKKLKMRLKENATTKYSASYFSFSVTPKLMP